MSADGRYVVFESFAPNLVVNQDDVNRSFPGSHKDVFVYDRQTGQTRLVSHAGDGITTSNFTSTNGQISGNGSRIVFTSSASNLLPGVGGEQLYVYEMATGVLSLVSHTSESLTTGAGASGNGMISFDGSHIAFTSRAPNLVTGLIATPDGGSYVDSLYVYNVATKQITLVSHHRTNPLKTANSSVTGFTISDNGQRIAYQTYATDLNSAAAVTEANDGQDIYVYDVQTGQNTLVSRDGSVAWTTANSESFDPRISGNGERIVFSSYSTNIHGRNPLNDPNGVESDVFVYDIATAQLTLVSHSVANPNVTGARGTGNAQISANGLTIVFEGGAYDLVAGEVDETINDVFLYDVATNSNRLVTKSVDGKTGGSPHPLVPTISRDGSRIVYTTLFQNLIPGGTDTNSAYDIYAYHVATASTFLVSHLASHLTRTGNQRSSRPLISGDGNVVAFESDATDLIAKDYNAATDVFALALPSQGVRIVQSAGTTQVIEGFQRDTFTVALPVAPAGSVTVTLNAGSQLQLSSDGINYSSTLVLNFTNTTPRTITVRGVNDEVVEDPPFGVVTTVITGSADPLKYAVGTSTVPIVVQITDGSGVRVIGEFDGMVSYTENAVPVLLDTNATVVDVDSVNLATGTLTVALIANGESTDRIGIKHVGTAARQIGVSGTNVTYGGVVIGTFSGTTTLTVVLNANATPAAVQALLRSVTFQSTSENPSILDRTVQVTLTDGAGGTSNSPTKTVKVVAKNDAPVIGAFNATVTYTENTDPVLLDTDATVEDIDSAEMANGKLTVGVIANSQTTDRIGVRNVGSAVGQIGVTGTTVSYGGVAIGTFAGTTTLTVTLNANATAAAVQALLRNITYSSVSENPSVPDRTIRATLSDGDGGTSAPSTMTVQIVAINDAPVIAAFDTTVTYTENAVPVLLDTNAAVIEPDSLNLATGTLTVAIIANAESTDRIGIKDVGTAARQIGVSGSTVTYGGFAFGTFSGTVTLTVVLNANSTPAAVQALLRNITFQTLSENPSILDRTVRVMLTDGDGGTSNSPTKTVKVVAKNDAPVIGAFNATVTYTENTDPVVLDMDATVEDIDSAEMATGKLTVGVIANSQITDRIGIRNVGSAVGQIGVSGTTVNYGGIAIGTFAGTTTLTVTLNANATAAAVQALLRNITYSNVSENPSVPNRTIRATLSDGDGGTSNISTMTVQIVAINDAPVIGAFDTTVTYTENAVPVLLDTNATVIEPDSLNLATGTLTVAIIANAQSTDRIGIKHVGIAAGQIGLSGTNVTYGGVAIGTFSGTTTLTVVLNANSTPAAVQALLRNITFQSTSENPSILDRTVQVTLTDGDGGTSNSPAKTVKVVAKNDAPVIGAVDTTENYTPGGSPVLVAGNATVSDIDSTNFDTGMLTVAVMGGREISDRIEILHQGTGVGQIGVSGLNVTFGGTVIGTFSGTTSLIVRLNSAATSAAVQALLRRVSFRSTAATPSTADRQIKTTLTDGDGGLSAPSTTTVTISNGVSSLSAASFPGFSDLDDAFSLDLIEADLLVS